MVRKLQGAKTRNNKWHLTRILLYHPKGIDQCHIDVLPNSLFEEKNWRLYTYHKSNFKNLNLNNYFLSEYLAFQSTLKVVRRRSQRGKEKRREEEYTSQYNEITSKTGHIRGKRERPFFLKNSGISTEPPSVYGGRLFVPREASP